MKAFEVEVVPTLTPAGAGALADATFEVFRKAAFPLVVISTATNVPLFAAIASLVLFIRERGWAWGTFGYFAVLGLLAVSLGVSAWIRALGTGAMAHAAGEAASGRPSGAVASLLAALRVGALLPLICGVRLLLVAIGAIACLLPGVSILAGFALAPHACILEGRGLGASVSRSLRLGTAGVGGLTGAAALIVAIYLIGTLQLLLSVRLAEVLVTLAVPSFPTGWLLRPEAPWLLLAGAKILADPFVSAATTAVFMDSRIRTDGLDLELRAQAVGGVAPSLVPSREAA